MRFVLFFLLLSSFGVSLSAQCIEDSLNMELKFRYDDPTQPGIYNDVWGYVDQDNREYAIIGASDSILIFDITDTDNVVKVGAEHGDGTCTWRDMKTWRNTLYAGSECGDGLLIFDLSNLPTSFSRINKIDTEFTTSHNIYIDSTNSARLYAVGTNGGTNGHLRS
jgi:choice-of-anchor B domain-containing protein